MAYLILTIVVITALVGTIFYAIYNVGAEEDLLATNYEVDVLEKENVKAKPPRIIPDGFVEYENDDHHFSFFHPAGMTATEYEEATGANTIVFESAETGFGFQIFIVPYDGEVIVESRFREDIPSGIIKDLTEVVIADSLRALIFFSEDAQLGETREVWFLNDGYLYEITTRKEFDTQLSEIVNTWQFTQ